MLVIVQNPGMSNFAFTDDFPNEPNPESAFSIPTNFPQTCAPSLPSVTTLNCPDPSSSLPEHEGLQLRVRSSSDLPTANEFGIRKESHHRDCCDKEPKDGNKKCSETKDSSLLYVNEVVVDVKGLKGYTFLPFESACTDSRVLHSRSTSSLNLQAFVPHQASIV